MNNLTRPRMERIILLDREIRNGNYPNCTSFSQKLAGLYGYERPLDRRTIERDLDYLRDALRAPIAWSYQEKGFYYTEASWQLPTCIAISKKEMSCLLAACEMLPPHQDDAVRKSLYGLFEKLSLFTPLDCSR